MVPYDEFDREFVTSRIAEFRDQVERRLAGEITEEQFRPLRLMNGVYLRDHAYMLRVSLPYGLLDARQLRMLAHVARLYDRGYAQFTARQSIEFHWPALADIPLALADLASVGLYSIETNGDFIRDTSADHLAGAAADEIADPRPYAEILRKWSAAQPEFISGQRKPRIAVAATGRESAAVRTSDIGLHLKKDADGRLGFAVWVGGGHGHTPLLATKVRDFLPEQHLLSYVASIMRVYAHHGLDDLKVRLRTLVEGIGAEECARRIEAEWETLRGGGISLADADLRAIEAFFAPPLLADRPEGEEAVRLARFGSPAFSHWLDTDVADHQDPDYASVTIPLTGGGAISDSQMEALADLALTYGFDEVRVGRERDLILPHVAQADLKPIHDRLVESRLGGHAHTDTENFTETHHAREARAA